jgi:HPt (histidine-containing phosphotransfer) domain-containing protein
MNAFVTKPFDPGTLIDVIRQEIERVRGMPVAVRVRERVTGASEPSWPVIEGIDREAVGPLDAKEFTSLLQRFFYEFDDLAQDSAFDLNDPTRRERCCQRVHKLRGSAGVLGATDVHLLAGEAEHALRDRAANIAEVAARVRQLGAALAQLHSRASPVLAAVQAKAPPRLQATAPPGPDAIRALLKLLHEGDFIAHQRFGELAEGLRGLLSAKDFAYVRDAIESYRFADAAVLLETCLVAA